MADFDHLSPDTAHQALQDITKIRDNSNALRTQESDKPSTSPPSNPVPFEMWTPADTKTTYQRNGANTQWNYRWSETDPPAKTTDLNNHTGTNITSTVAVHGIKQGSGNGFDADTLDGYHASSFLQASHSAATSGVHGSGSGVLLSAPTTTPFLVIASTAPTGWTQITTWNDRVIRIVSGNGAATGGNWNISGLSTFASHNHAGSAVSWTTISDNNNDNLWALSPNKPVYSSGSGLYIPDFSGSNYSAVNRITGLSTNIATTGAYTPTGDGSWRPAYLDVIAVTKNA